MVPARPSGFLRFDSGRWKRYTCHYHGRENSPNAGKPYQAGPQVPLRFVAVRAVEHHLRDLSLRFPAEPRHGVGSIVRFLFRRRRIGDSRVLAEGAGPCYPIGRAVTHAYRAAGASAAADRRVEGSADCGVALCLRFRTAWFGGGGGFTRATAEGDQAEDQELAAGLFPG